MPAALLIVERNVKCRATLWSHNITEHVFFFKKKKKKSLALCYWTKIVPRKTKSKRVMLQSIIIKLKNQRYTSYQYWQDITTLTAATVPWRWGGVSSPAWGRRGCRRWRPAASGRAPAECTARRRETSPWSRRPADKKTGWPQRI